MNMNQPRHFLLPTRTRQDGKRIRAALRADPLLAGCEITEITNANKLGRALPGSQSGGTDGANRSPAASERYYDLILSHLTINGLSGPELVDRIRQAQPDTPLILLATDDEIEQAAEIAVNYDVPIVPCEPRYLPLLPGTVRAELRSERALRQSEERFRRIAENAPDLIFRWSYAHGFDYVSPASVDVIGYTPEEHYADPGLAYRSIHLDDIPIYESVFSDLADPNGPRRYCVIRWQHKDGHIVHVEMRMTPIFDRYGNLIAIEGIARDISQHVRARERLRELTSRLTNAQEEERRRIARELHDEVGQALSIAKMRMRMLQNALPGDATDAADKLKLLDDLIKETLQNVRTLSHELRPPLLDEMGWEPAIESLCDSFSQRTDLPVKFEYDGEPLRLAPEVELTAYRVVQEALTNAARHAAANQATVRAELTEDALCLLIEDDGQGFDMEALQHTDKPNHGLGLLSMRERVDSVGGEIEIYSEPGCGTRVTVRLPLHEVQV